MISSILKTIFDDVLFPAAIAGAGAAFPFFGALMAVPILGPVIRKALQFMLDKLIDNGIIELKVGLIEQLSESAKAHYAPEIQILRDAQSQDELTPEQEEEYAKKLQDAIRNRPDIVRG